MVVEVVIYRHASADGSFIHAVQHFVSDEVRVIDKRTERVNLVNLLLTVFPYWLIPFQIHIRVLEDHKVRNRLIVVSCRRKVVAFHTAVGQFC